MIDHAESGGAPVSAGGQAVTLVEGSSFCVSDAAGRIHSGLPQGVFYLDTRIVASWSVAVNGEDVEPLAVFTRQPNHATFLGRSKARREGPDSTLVVQRERYVGSGMREDVALCNVAADPVSVTLEISVDSDFADLFAVKEGRIRPNAESNFRMDGGVLEINSTMPGNHRGIRIEAPEASVAPGKLVFNAVIPAREEWRTTVHVLPAVDGFDEAAKLPVGEPTKRSAPDLGLQQWTEQTPVFWGAGGGLLRTLGRSQQDLGSLRIYDPDHPEHPAVAAGAPWFMALFGRDSLLTSYMALPVDQQLALGTLQTLARYQGAEVNPLTEEQPGRILHERRFGNEAALALGGGNVYFGTVDATPLFVIVLAELARWGASDSDLLGLLPHADRAMEWIDGFGDRDGDGFVEYQRLNDRGLRNQGWKDSWDGVNFADGRIAEPPIALCEVQGYVYAAYLGRAALARRFGDDATADRLNLRATALKAAFNEQFWLPDRQWFAVGLDRDGRRIDSLTSNMGHCLWSGIVDDDKAAAVADHLLSPRMFSGWGVRTLATDMGAYNPISYHNGSVWPHDNAIIAAGLMRYGFVEQAQRVAQAVLTSAECFDGRLPELFTGLNRTDFPRPVEYPTSCHPQAWASAAPLQLMRTLLRFDPDLHDNKVYLEPVLPDSIPEFHMRNAPLGQARLSLSASHSAVELNGLPPDVAVVRGQRDH